MYNRLRNENTANIIFFIFLKLNHKTDVKIIICIIENNITHKCRVSEITQNYVLRSEAHIL